MVVVPVILAGGIGERFWPLSKSSLPKQLLKIISDKTMLEETLLRVNAFCSSEACPIIITSEKLSGKLREALPSYEFDLIKEVVGKNTAPAIALAARMIQAKYGDSVMVILSADHDIRPVESFAETVKFAVSQASKTGALTIFGIKPSRPDTGYGYIHLGDKLETSGENSMYEVKRFVEKPDSEKAKSFCKSGDYFWNSGIFLWKTSTILEEFGSYMPDLMELLNVVEKDNFSQEKIDWFYNTCEKQSIDYGIMEHSKRVNVVVGNFSWDDIGSWESVGRVRGQNDRGVTTMGGSIYERECSKSIVVNESSKALAVIGLENAVVVTTNDAVVVIDRSKLPEYKKFITE
ncbi:MAG: mannose-1-phosphate guanylyltransferase, partial [Fibrobacter sp.]|nr:mannose-1-phosphate guanylyltransferase [Fibrobacter sp.]